MAWTSVVCRHRAGQRPATRRNRIEISPARSRGVQAQFPVDGSLTGLELLSLESNALWVRFDSRTRSAPLVTGRIGDFSHAPSCGVQARFPSRPAPDEPAELYLSGKLGA